MASQVQRRWLPCWVIGDAMTDAVLVALISGGLSLIGVFASNFAAVKKSEHAIRTSQAVTDTKLVELTREVREHNHFAQRMPVVEEQIKVINHRISDLEAFHK